MEDGGNDREEDVGNIVVVTKLITLKQEISGHCLLVVSIIMYVRLTVLTKLPLRVLLYNICVSLGKFELLQVTSNCTPNKPIIDLPLTVILY